MKSSVKERLERVVLFCVIVNVSMEARQSFQSIGQWRNFTDMKTVRAIAPNGNVLWAATSGGLFSYDTSTFIFHKYTVSDGLASNDLTAVFIDDQGSVWVGASDGNLNVFDGNWRQIPDIALANKTQKSIRRFLQHGDSMFVASDFGVSVYVMSKEGFGDTYANFGFSTQARVNSVLIQSDRIWVATDQGVATALSNSANLTDPNSWTRYGTGQGLPATNTTSLCLFRDTLVAGTVNGAACFSGGSFQSVASLASKQILDFEQQGSVLYILWGTASSYSVESLGQISGSSQLVTSNSGLQSQDFLMFSPTDFWVSTSGSGIAEWNGATWKYVFPNGPQSNLFLSLLVDNYGAVWAASGISGGGRGFYRYDPSKPEGSQWKNFTSAVYPILQFDDYYKVSQGNNNSVWVSSWGRGVVEVAGDSIRRRVDANSTPSLAPSVPVDPNVGPFVVVGGIAGDAGGSLWFANRTAINGNFLARLSSDTTFTYYRNPNSEGFFTSIVVDREGTKWMANSEAASKNPKGLFFFNEKGLVSGTDAFGWGFMSTVDGLPDAVVMSVSVDQDGDVWIGTDLGVMIVTDPRFPKIRRTSSFPLREQSVQAIAVDGLNNKWVGTREGVFVVNSDGTQLLQQYTVLTTNGKLVSNDIRSIAIDQNRGIAYFGTEKGLSSLNITAVQPQKEFTALEAGPNPYVIPGDNRLVIRNLVANTTIKILSVNGLLVSEFKAQGAGRAFWDGRDDKGRLVSSGVYFIVAFSENGNQTTTGKIAVVRR